MPTHYITRAAAALAFVAAAVPAGAEDCSRWHAEIWEVEGGEAMTAHVCAATDGEREALFQVQCWEAGRLVVTYDDGGNGGPPDDDYDYGATFRFRTGPTTAEAELRYSAMDGVMTNDVPADGPLARLLRSGESLEVVSPTAQIASRRFTLEGAAAAIDTVEKSCSTP